MKTLSLLLLLLLCPPSRADLFTKGRLAAGGSLTFPVEWRPALQTTLSINAEPDFGIIFADGWLLSLGLRLRTPILESRLPLGDRWRWGLNVTLAHYWDVDWKVKPFVGLQIDYLMKSVDFSSIEASLGVPVGVFVPVSDSVGLELGLRARITFVGLPKIVESVRVDPGYLGIRAFF